MRRLILCQTGTTLLDAISHWSGYAALRVPLERASRAGDFTLAVPGFRQINCYSCGAVAAAMAAMFLYPTLGFEQVHAAVDPRPKTGAGVTRVVRALRSLEIEVSHKTDLIFPAIRTAIRAGSPVLACVKTIDARTVHWVTIYGYGQNPDALFVAGQGLPLFSSQRRPWKSFTRKWTPAGMGLICRRNH